MEWWACGAAGPVAVGPADDAELVSNAIVVVVVSPR